jgi:hypothetical protein
MSSERANTGKVFIEYIIINKAKNEQVPLKGFAWEEDGQNASNGVENPNQTFPLKIFTADQQYVEHFLEDEILHCLTQPHCFSSVEKKISCLFGRIRKERSQRPASVSEPETLSRSPSGL